ncbi:hypothetical protein MHU86_24894 [Fragilaria crotonensis]|nr:hypothetical protein MHU86_24894 [Fragilaria crotonensis]
MGAESPEEFGAVEAEGNNILEDCPNHCLVTPSIFAIAKGSKSIDSKALAYHMIELFQLSVEDDNELSSTEKEEEAAGLESTLALLWASSQGLLNKVRLEDAPEESTMMNHLIKGVRDTLAGRDASTTHPGLATAPAATTGGESASMELMAAPSQSMVALLSKFQDGSEAESPRKEADKLISKTMGPTQRDLFTSLCTRRMNVEPAMTTFMKSLASSKTPQKAFNLIQSETRDWEGTFPPAVSTSYSLTDSSRKTLTEQTLAASSSSCSILRRYPSESKVRKAATSSSGSTSGWMYQKQRSSST